MKLDYARYYDAVLGGWIGKSIGGAIGARFEGNKGWIELDPAAMFPAVMPPNDDLDLQVLWLKVLEEKGAALTSDDLAAAWLEGCWYPFNEYGIFRRNWKLGIHPPYSGSFTNQFWETGEGCPIRAEVWGYVFPGAPDLAAKYAAMDGVLDHTAESVGAEQMLAAMSSMAFFVPDVRRLASMFIHYLPAGSSIDRLTRAAFACYDEGLSLRDARDRLMALAGNPEACDARTNIPFTFLGLLYGGNDMQAVMLAALRCGYDTDCTLASAAALVGQILGAGRIPAHLKGPVGDELVMGIQYRRPEMTLTALARDTVRMGVLLARGGIAGGSGVEIEGAPVLAPLPAAARAEAVPQPRLRVTYAGLPAAAPGEAVLVTVHIEGRVPVGAVLSLDGPQDWVVAPRQVTLDGLSVAIPFTLHAPAAPQVWPARNLFTVTLQAQQALTYTFGVYGSGLWKLLGIYYDALPDEKDPLQVSRRFNQHYVALEREYIPEPAPDAPRLFADWSRKLGRPALLPSYEHEIDLTRLIGLTGPYCAYLERTLISPLERDVYLTVGNNDGFRLYLNGEKVLETNETVWWAPFNHHRVVHLRQGENRLLLKLLKRSDALHFTLGLRETGGEHPQFNCTDWLVDTSEKV